MTVPGSIFAALLTPMEDNGAISTDRIKPLVDFILSRGVHGLYASGSTGESVMQSREERIAHLQALAGYARGKCTLVAHVGAAATDDSIALAKISADAGYDALAAVPPFYYQHSESDVRAYYEAIAGATDLPLLVYNIPALTGTVFSTQGLLDLLDIPNVSGIKYTAPNLFQFNRLRNARPDHQFFFGTDEMFLGAVAMGSDGGIGSTYNLIGDVYVGIEDAVAAKDIEGARALQNKANDLIALLIGAGVVAGLKYALTRMGIPVGPCRAPFRIPAPGPRAKLDAWLDENGYAANSFG